MSESTEQVMQRLAKAHEGFTIYVREGLYTVECDGNNQGGFCLRTGQGKTLHDALLDMLTQLQLASEESEAATQ